MKTPRRIAAEERPFSFVERGLDGLCDRYIGKANVSEAKSVSATASGAFEAFFGTFMCQVLCLAGARRKKRICECDANSETVIVQKGLRRGSSLNLVVIIVIIFYLE